MSRPCRLYLITPPSIAEPASFARLLAEALEAGPVAALQIRLKSAPEEHLAEVVRITGPIARDHGVALILNDRPDLAARMGCDGVHIGQEDTPYAQARRLLGSDRIVGVTCHDSRHLAMLAAEAGADYVAFGAFYPTLTKTAPTRADPDILTSWQETMLTPCVAIGGIEPGNCRPLVSAGADFLAASSGVWNFPGGPGAAVDLFKREIDAALATPC
jgi:thiamine-phosphate pyrophosphorylase